MNVPGPQTPCSAAEVARAFPPLEPVRSIVTRGLKSACHTRATANRCVAALALVLSAVGLQGQPGSQPAKSRPLNASDQSIGYPDISTLTPDLEPPRMTTGEPAPGRRVRATLPAYRNTDVYYSL